MTIIDDFVNIFTSTNTRHMYRVALKKYFEVIGCEPEVSYFSPDRNYEADVQAYITYLTTTNKAPTSITTRISVIKSFLSENGVELSKTFWIKNKRRIKGNRPITIDEPPTKDKLKLILSHADLKTKALVTVLLSSGMRVGECHELTVEDINFDSRPTKIEIPAIITKTGSTRYVFISDEATDYLKEWLKVRDNWLEQSSSRMNFKNRIKSVNDNRLFPFGVWTGRDYWNKCLSKAGFDTKDRTTGFRRHHIHTLRKFFASEMTKEMNAKYVDYLLGHTSGLSGAYFRPREEDVAKEYLGGMYLVTVYHSGFDTKDIEELKQEIKRRDGEIDELKDSVQQSRDRQNRIYNLMNKISKLKERIYFDDYDADKEEDVDINRQIDKLERELESLLNE